MCWRMVSGSGIFPAPVSPHASLPLAGSMISIPYFLNASRLFWVTAFSYIAVFIAGTMILGHLQARKVVVSMSSAIPWAILAITLAVAGAITATSAFWARATCSTWNSKFLSNVSITQRLPVSVSKVIGVIKFVACSVISTWTSAWDLTSMLARLALLYAAIPPVTPRRIVFPFNIVRFPFCSSFHITITITCFGTCCKKSCVKRTGE